MMRRWDERVRALLLASMPEGTSARQMERLQKAANAASDVMNELEQPSIFDLLDRSTE
jgi:hypothetical protein